MEEANKESNNAELNEQILALTQMNEQLKEELIKRQAQERSLRYIINVLTSYYGAENVQNILKLTKPQDYIISEVSDVRKIEFLIIHF